MLLPQQVQECSRAAGKQECSRTAFQLVAVCGFSIDYFPAKEPEASLLLGIACTGAPPSNPPKPTKPGKGKDQAGHSLPVGGAVAIAGGTPAQQQPSGMPDWMKPQAPPPVPAFMQTSAGMPPWQHDQQQQQQQQAMLLQQQQVMIQQQMMQHPMQSQPMQGYYQGQPVSGMMPGMGGYADGAAARPQPPAGYPTF